ncbi:hypothetical protein EVAR_7821_1 [Eumeta japonica]|uniref:Uncharacterized protein n=1 Tax=Eumeta variegata TaxID=151549 RepID=A0A4C1TVA7_EUMVA|nr:hypothetical protein EVAR_7821_1 [Eumeta japonica]
MSTVPYIVRDRTVTVTLHRSDTSTDVETVSARPINSGADTGASVYTSQQRLRSISEDFLSPIPSAPFNGTAHRRYTAVLVRPPATSLRLLASTTWLRGFNQLSYSIGINFGNCRRRPAFTRIVRKALTSEITEPFGPLCRNAYGRNPFALRRAALACVAGDFCYAADYDRRTDENTTETSAVGYGVLPGHENR